MPIATAESNNSERNAFQQAWDRITAGNIDDQTGQSEAVKRYREGGTIDGAIQEHRNTDAEVADNTAIGDAKQRFESPVSTEGDDFHAEPAAVVAVADAEKDKVDDVWADDKLEQRGKDVAAHKNGTAPVVVTEKKVVVAPKKDDKPVAVMNTVTEKSLPLAETKPNTFGSKLPMPEGALEQLKYVVQGKDYKAPVAHDKTAELQARLKELQSMSKNKDGSYMGGPAVQTEINEITEQLAKLTK